MAKYKEVSESFLVLSEAKYLGNMVKNYNGRCRESDFFLFIDTWCPKEKAIALIKAAYGEEELKEMKNGPEGADKLDFDESLDKVFQALWNNEKSRTKTRAVIKEVLDLIRAENMKETANEPVKLRFDELQRLLKLSELEMEIVLVAYLDTEATFAWPTDVADRQKADFYAMALDRSCEEVAEALSPKSHLIKLGLLDSSWQFGCSTIVQFLNGTCKDPVMHRFYKQGSSEQVIPWEFFGDLAENDGKIVEELISSCNGKCNILLYGASGTGKTTFAHTLAAQLGRKAFEIRQGGEDGRDSNSQSRMIGVSVCNDQENPEDALIIVDEADELLRATSGGIGGLGLTTGGGKSTEKGVMNAILDEMRIPAIWISNAPATEMDASVRRRFDYSICFESLSRAQRIAVWRNIVGKLGLSATIGEDKIEEYAAKYETSAGGISTVLSNVKHLKPKYADTDALVAKLMRPHCRLMGVKDSGRFLPTKGYSLDGLNIKGKVGLEKIVKGVGNFYTAGFNAGGEDRPRMNILLHGAPGTGKTEFVKYLGQKLDRKVVTMKGSDLLSKWVGESEQNIASAFRQAEAENAILFFDEVDGILQSRESARNEWQISQVNEILQQMESFNGVMVAATNFCRNLDAAVMRRFTFKLEFDYLDDDGKKRFFERFFKTELTDGEYEELKTLANLAPGDFRTVRQEEFYLGEPQSNADRIAALAEECKYKKAKKVTRRIGF